MKSRDMTSLLRWKKDVEWKLRISGIGGYLMILNY